jgi:hemolysin activation/secretion protein
VALLILLSLSISWPLAAESVDHPAAIETNATPHFSVAAFQVQGKYQLSTNILLPLFAPYTGANVSLDQIRHAASTLELTYVQQGYPNMNIVVSPNRIKDGIVTLDAFPGAMAQIVVAGHRYSVATNGVEVAINQPVTSPPTGLPPTQSLSPPKNASVVTRTNDAGPRFTVKKYQVLGNSLLQPLVISQVLTNVPGAFGTNVSLDRIQEVVVQLRVAYRERGFATVYVGLPQQRLTNAVVKIQVVEGRLASIAVKGNKYFSTDNVLRSMPGLYTNMILNSLTFQAQLNQANANQDRQIYPLIEPGPDPGTSDLTLEVKDRMPVHAKTELNNQNSPGTPDLRVNSSAVYDNLWQQEHVLGLQYSFSPEQYKGGPQWNFYDLPSVANYSTFYRIPLGDPDAIDDVIAANPGSFGYSEATRKFNLPPSSGQPDLTIFASRSTIDNGLLTGPTINEFTEGPTNSSGHFITTNSTLNSYPQSQDLTINNDLGLRFNDPLNATANFHSSLSGGFDFKTYASTSIKTNINLLKNQIIDTLSDPSHPQTNYNNSSVIQPVPPTYNRVYYLPLTLRYDCGWHDFLGQASLGMGLSGNLGFTALNQTEVGTNTTDTYLHRASALQAITGSAESTGHWIVLTPSFSHTFELITNWSTTVRADGQWASEPLISNEQFGAGGVNSVRGYQEGEVFGDTGWHVSMEEQSPPHTFGMIQGRIPLIIRGTIFTDYAQVYLLDPLGRDANQDLWGTGIGCVSSIGSSWETRLLLSVPLISTTTTSAYRPYFSFSLTAQF